MIKFMRLNVLSETERRLIERVVDHNVKDAKSHVFQHAIDKEHRSPTIDEFEIIGRSLMKLTFNREVTRSLLIKDVRPSRNTNENLCHSIYLIETSTFHRFLLSYHLRIRRQINQSSFELL